jgi:glyoxylase-like metal-dependent hydrolase (beta-lactamase superfamily II)
MTSKPIKYVVLSHYHAVRVLGTSAYRAQQVIANQATLGRFPRLFRGARSIPG